jgi:lipopolysaccharide/colanic/teichoic acid biosynthesis glycosyltransferase
VASAEAHALRGPGRERFDASSKPPVALLRARVLISLLAAEIAPALALGALTYLGCHDVAVALAAFGTAMIVSTRLRKYRLRASLMPLAGLAVWVAPVLLGSLVAYAAGSMDEIEYASKTFNAAGGALIVLAIGAWMRREFRRRRPIRAAVIGEEQQTADLVRELELLGAPQYELVGRVDPSTADAAEAATQVPCIGTLATIREAALEHELDLLISLPEHALGGASRRQVLDAVASCLDLPLRLIDGQEAYELLLGHVPLALSGPAWVEPMLDPHRMGGSRRLTRVRDIAITLLLAPVALPLLGLCALAVRVFDGAPLLHRQRRIGEGGRAFTVTKLRTMHRDVEGDQWWCAEDDPRVTKVGRFLRRTHLDELPQLWSVVTGEMGLVGPRPEVPEIVDRLEGEYRYYDRRHLVRPGLTGWAQVRCGYSGTDLGSAWKLCFDLYYLKHRTAIFDLLIMIETLRVVVGGGQYGLRRPNPRLVLNEAEQHPSVHRVAA